MSASIIGIFVFVASLILGLKVGKAKTNKPNDDEIDFDVVGFPQIDIDLFRRFVDVVTSIKNVRSFSVPDSLIYSVIKKESDSLYKTKSNSDIIGDKNLRNKAFGFMQVRLPALLDVNVRYGFTFTENDLRNEVDNLTVGIGYLSMCYEKAIDEKAFDVVRLTFKKYNSGIGTKENAIGGTGYSSTAINFYEVFNNLV